MSKVHIVTDSSSDLPFSVREQFNIHLVSMAVIFGDEVYQDIVELSSEEFYAKLAKGGLPSTSQPSPADFVKCYEEIASPGDTIISVHVSGKLSGTLQSANIAAEMVKDINVIALDSESASLALGLMAIAAAEAVQKGGGKDEAVAAIEYIKANVSTYFVVDTLDLLRRNGRIGGAAALLGSVLKIKPILTVEDGVIATFDKVRGKANALKQISDLATEVAANNPGRKLRIAISHGNISEEAEAFLAEVQARVGTEQVFVTYIGPTVGSHVGAGALAMFFYPI